MVCGDLQDVLTLNPKRRDVLRFASDASTPTPRTDSCRLQGGKGSSTKA